MTVFLSRFIRNTGRVEPPSKSTTANNDLKLEDDAIEIETSEIVQQQKFDLTKVSKAKMVIFV